MLKTQELYRIEDVYGVDILNIFSDASTRRAAYMTTAAAYTSMAICQDNIVNKFTRVHSDSTSNAEELRGLRGSLRWAIKYARFYRRINIFTDSKYTVDAMRNFNSYRYNYDTGMYYTNFNKNKLLQNQSIIIECAQLLIKALDLNPNISIYHQKGHVDAPKLKSIKNACKVFARENNMRNYPSYDVMRYLSVYNNYCDIDSRGMLYRTNIINGIYKDPAEFFALGKIMI